MADNGRRLDHRTVVMPEADRDARRAAHGSSAARRRSRSPRPGARPALEADQALVDQHRQQLLDEQRVPLRGVDDPGADPLRRARSCPSRCSATAPSRPPSSARARCASAPGPSTTRAAARRARGARCRRRGAEHRPRARRPARSARGTWPRPSGCPRTGRAAGAPDRSPRGACERPRSAPRRETPWARDRSLTRRAPRPRRPPRGSASFLARTPSCPARRSARGWRTASASGQNVMPSPYGRQRPRRTVASSASEPTSSSIRRDLPTPASPITVTSLQRRASIGFAECLRELRELVRSTHHRRVEAPWPLGVAPHADEAESRHALGLSLQLERLDLLHVDVVTYEPVRQVPEQDLLGARRLLQARRDVHGVPDHEPLARRRVAGDDLTRVHARPHGEPHPPLALELVVHARRAPPACRRPRAPLSAHRPRAASGARTRP